MMKRGKILGLLLALAALFSATHPFASAVTMGTAFTYQGRFMDAGSAANDTYDFQFKLYDALASGTQQGSTVYSGDVDVNDGYFTVTLDFGASVFEGDARWLEIAVRPGDSTGAYTTLTPRHELTPGGYALYSEQTKGITVSGGNVGVGTASPARKLQVVGGRIASGKLNSSNTGDIGGLDMYSSTDHADRRNWTIRPESTNYGMLGFWVSSSNSSESASATQVLGISKEGKVGIGTTSPSCWLTVDGEVESLGVGVESTKLFMHGTQHYAGLRSYTTASGKLPVSLQQQDSGSIAFSLYIDAAGQTGIGTTLPIDKLHVNGNVRCVSLIQTSDEQLKTDVRPLGSVLDKLDRVEALSYRWNEKGQSLGGRNGTRELGVMAQELEEVFPELVVTPEPVDLEELLASYSEEARTPELRERLTKDVEGTRYKAVDYSKLTVVLLEAVKELRAENKALDQRVTALEKRLQ